MCDRKNTLVCSFDPDSPRLTAYEVHEWIHDQLKILGHVVLMIQIDGTRRQVFIKLYEPKIIDDLLMSTNGQFECKHMTGEISVVKLEMAGMGTRRVRVANLTPELSGTIISTSLAKYGVILDIQAESWSKQCRYVVANGIRIVTMTIQKHLPSHINIAGCRALTSYEGQPKSCYGCGATDRMYQVCPKRQKSTVRRIEEHGLTWAQRTAAGPSHIESNDEETQSNQTVAAQTTARQTDADCVINEEGDSDQEQPLSA
jgi:hypothetical protein